MARGGEAWRVSGVRVGVVSLDVSVSGIGAGRAHGVTSAVASGVGGRTDVVRDVVVAKVELGVHDLYVVAMVMSKVVVGVLDLYIVFILTEGVHAVGVQKSDLLGGGDRHGGGDGSVGDAVSRGVVVDGGCSGGGVGGDVDGGGDCRFR